MKIKRAKHPAGRHVIRAGNQHYLCRACGNFWLDRGITICVKCLNGETPQHMRLPDPEDKEEPCPLTTVFPPYNK